MANEAKIKELGTQIATIHNQAKSLYAEMEADEAKRTTDNREKWNKMIEDGKSLYSERSNLIELDRLGEELAPNGDAKTRQQPPNGGQTERKSWGVQMVNSDEFKAAKDAGFRSPKDIAPISVKALSESVSASGGSVVFSSRQTEIRDQAHLAPTTLLDILNVAQTDSNSIDFVAVTGFTNNAAEVKEWDTALTPDNFGLKPESDLTFELKNEPVQTIAHWIATSRNILADVPRLRNLIDVKMIQGLKRRIEGQIIGGNGTAPNIRGIRNTSGIQTRSGAAASASARYQATDTILDTIRRGITDVALAFGQADAVVLNPADAESMELQKDDNGNYMNVFDPVAQRVWRVRVVENMAMTANRGMVGDFSDGATLYLREDAVIRFFEQHADFAIRNALVILAEMRAALEVSEPEWFVDLNTLQ